MPDPVTSFRLPVKLKKQLAAAAVRLRISRSKLVIRIIREWFVSREAQVNSKVITRGDDK